MITELTDAIQSYPTLFVWCAFSGIGIPLPEDIPVLYAGVQIADGNFDVAPALSTLIAGILVRDTFAWLLGRLFGDHILGSAFAQRFLPATKLARARHLLSDRGPSAVMMGRFLVGFRVPVFLMAGAARIPLATFLVWDLLGAIVAVPLVCAVGYFAGPSILEGARIVMAAGPVIWISIGLFAGLIWWVRNRSPDQP